MKNYLQKVQQDLNIEFNNINPISEGVASESFIINTEDDSKIFLKTGRNEKRIQIETKILKNLNFNKKPQLIGYNYKNPSYVAMKYHKNNLQWNKNNFIYNFVKSLGQDLNEIHSLSPPKSIPTLDTNLKEYYIYDEPDINEKYTNLLRKSCSELQNITSEKCFIHGDVNFGNLILKKDGNINKFVDWESASYNYKLFDVAKAESSIDILSFYIDINRDKIIDIFRSNYNVKNEDELELWKFIRQYNNYQKFIKHDGNHYDYGFDKSMKFELKKQKELIKKQYLITNKILNK